MRIIGGTLKGIKILPPKDLPVRPTTDMAKEALFNILNNHLYWEDTHALDLFCGTGNVSFEMASRGAAQITSVDQHYKCCAFVKQMAEKHRMPITIVRDDVHKFIKRHQATYDLIFADPPYDMDALPQLAHTILESNLLKPGGLFIMEHPTVRKIEPSPYFSEERKYGQSTFSFFKKVKESNINP